MNPLRVSTKIENTSQASFKISTISSKRLFSAINNSHHNNIIVSDEAFKSN